MSLWQRRCRGVNGEEDEAGRSISDRMLHDDRAGALKEIKELLLLSFAQKERTTAENDRTKASSQLAEFDIDF